jgi:hypothetical protein
MCCVQLEIELMLRGRGLVTTGISSGVLIRSFIRPSLNGILVDIALQRRSNFSERSYRALCYRFVVICRSVNDAMTRDGA